MELNNQHTTPNTENTTPASSKPRRFVRGLWLGLGALLGFVVVAVAVVIIWLGPIAERVVERYDKEFVGRRLEMANLRIKLFSGELSVDSLRMFEANDSTHFASVDRFEISIELREAFKRHIDIKNITVTGPRAYVVQRGSQFNFDDILEFVDSTYLSSEPDTTAVEGEPWRVSIKNVALSKGEAHYLDTELDQQWRVDNLAIHSDSIVLGNAMTNILASMNINRRAQVEGALGINLEMLDFTFRGKVSKFALSDIYKYIVPAVNIQAIGGLLSTDLRLEGNANNITAMNIAGAIALDDFYLTASDGEELFSADNISTNIEKINLDKQLYTLSSLTASNYSTRFIMLKDGSTNFDTLFYAEPEVSLETASESVSTEIYDQREVVTITTDESSSPLSGMTVRIGELSLNKGNIFFADYTMAKPFEYNLSNINIESKEFDLSRRNKLIVRANMNRQGTAIVRWEGSLDDFHNQSLMATLQNVNMEDFTPYSEHYTAFPITSGNITFRSQNTVTNGQLSGINRLGTYDFKVGKKDKNAEPEYKIPLRLGVYVLTDKDNHIDIDLPITGHIDSPEFSLRKAIFKAIGKLLIKIVASPFSWMSPDKQDTFQAINYSLLDLALSSEQYARLDKIAEALKNDESLNVRLTQSVGYERARREIVELNLKMAYYNSTQREEDKRLDMLDFVRIQEMKISGKDVSEWADKELISRGIDPQHLSTHAKAEALYGDIVDMQLKRMMDTRCKIISDYISFQHKELGAERITIESMSVEQMKAYHGKECFAVKLIIDGEEVEVKEEASESDTSTEQTADTELNGGAEQVANNEQSAEEQIAEGASEQSAEEQIAEGASEQAAEEVAEQGNNSQSDALASDEQTAEESTEAPAELSTEQAAEKTITE